MSSYEEGYKENLRESIRLAAEQGHKHPEAEKLLAEAEAKEKDTNTNE